MEGRRSRKAGNRDEHCALELDVTVLNVKGNLYLYLYLTREEGKFNSE